MPEQKELSPVERAAQHVEAVKAQIKRVIGFRSHPGKGNALAALRRELAQAESALAAAKKAADAKSAAAAAESSSKPSISAK